MATQIQYRRGTDTQNDAFTGALGEITVDTTNKTLRVHDGATQGGSNIATVSYVDSEIGSIQANAITFGSTAMSIASSNANIVASVAGTTTLTIAQDKVGVGTSATDAKLTVGGNKSASSWTTNGIGLRLSGATYTDSSTSASGTAVTNHIHAMSIPSLAATNGGVTTTDAATLYIAGAPAASTNMTITNPWAFRVQQDNSYFGGAVTVIGNITGGNLNTGSQVVATGNITGGNLNTGSQVVATGNITGGNLITSGLASVSSIVKTGSTGVGNIGQSDNSFNTVFAKATSAQYADLAEKYEADSKYAPGTVLVIGGEKEVTQCSKYADPSAAGVVSTNPAHLMNSELNAEYTVDLALTGRVPCCVVGAISKGDLLTTSEIEGTATRLLPGSFVAGCVIGKALENYNSKEAGVIEVLVGKI